MKKIVLSLIAVAVILVVNGSAFAHSGRTDSFGGHYVRTPGLGRVVGTYHFHGF